MSQSFSLDQDVMEAQSCLPVATISYIDETVGWSPPAQIWYENETVDPTVPARTWTVNETTVKSRISLKTRTKSSGLAVVQSGVVLAKTSHIPSKARVASPAIVCQDSVYKAKPEHEVKSVEVGSSRQVNDISDVSKLHKPTPPIQKVCPMTRAAPPSKPDCINIKSPEKVDKQSLAAPDDKKTLKRNRRRRRRPRANGDSLRRFAFKNAWRARRHR